MQTGFLRDTVVDHFTNAAADYSDRKGIVHPEADPLIIEFVKELVSTVGIRRVLEVGGGSGYLLDLLAHDTDETQFVNCELAYQAYSKQIGSSTDLIGGNALSLPFADSRFDLVITKNLFHHLVGGTRQESKMLAQRAADELRRVVTSGGHLIVLEQYHQSRLGAAIIFYLTLWLAKGSFRIDAFGVRPKVVVSFLTPSEVQVLLGELTGQDTTVMRRARAIPTTLFIRLLPYLGQFGRLLLVNQVSK